MFEKGSLKKAFIQLLSEERSKTADYSEKVVKDVTQIKAILKGHESAKHTKIIDAFLDASKMLKLWKEQEALYKNEAKSVFPELFDTEEMGAQLTVETVSTTLTLVARAKKEKSSKEPVVTFNFENAFEELYSYVIMDLLPRLQKFDDTMKQLKINVDKEIAKVGKIKKDNTTVEEPEDNVDEPFDFEADLQARRLTVKANSREPKKIKESFEDLNEGLVDVWVKMKKWLLSKLRIAAAGFEKSSDRLEDIKTKFKI